MLFFKHRSVPNSFAHSFGAGRYLIFFLPFIFLSLFNSCNIASDPIRSDSNYDKVLDSANHAFETNKYEAALHYLDSATCTYHDLSLLQKFEYYSFNCNYFFHLKKDNNISMLYADSLLNLFDTPEKRMKYPGKYGQAFFSKGDVLFGENKFNEAYQYYYQGKLIASKSINQCALHDYSYRMGMIMYKQGHYSLAAANFKNSLNEEGACDLTFIYFYRRQELLSNIGLSYSKINEDDSAMSYYKKTLDYIDTQAPQFNVRKELINTARGVVYGNEADIYIRKKDFQMAAILLQKSSGINLKPGGDHRDAELSEMKLAHLYFQTNQSDLLFKLLNVVHSQLDTIKNMDAEADWNFLMAYYFIKKDNSKTALNYFIKYNVLKDSILNRDKGLKEADVNQHIKELEKDSEFNDLKKDNKLQDLYLRIAAVFGMMLLLILFLILLNWWKSRKNIKILGGLNFRINDQNTNLEKALNEIKSSSQEKDRILRAVAHDLRNPIGGIAALTKVMADDDYTNEQKELISLIKETSQNSLELINELLEVTNNGSTKLVKEPVEMNALLSHSVELLRFKAAEKDQEINLKLLPAPVELLISREKIWRVISNLISNAIKFSPLGAIIYVELTDYDKEVEVSVKDSGIGIPENMQSKVFNIFTEAKRPGTAGEKSFGLGLSISKQIIENHHGTICFDSDIKNGTTFYFRLPKTS